MKLYDVFRSADGVWFAAEDGASSALCGTDVAPYESMKMEPQDALNFLQDQGPRASVRCIEILQGRAAS